jgi:hypothetical protein
MLAKTKDELVRPMFLYERVLNKESSNVDVRLGLAGTLSSCPCHCFRFLVSSRAST